MSAEKLPEKKPVNLRIRRADFFLIAFVFVLILLFFLLQKPWERAEGAAVVITVGGEVYGVYPLDTDEEIAITNSGGEVTNVLRIEDHAAKMTEASCPDKLCLHQKKINAAQESIVCLPNRIVVSIEDGDASGIDAMSR